MDRCWPCNDWGNRVHWSNRGNGCNGRYGRYGRNGSIFNRCWANRTHGRHGCDWSHRPNRGNWSNWGLIYC